jgi:hypothetical protein
MTRRTTGLLISLALGLLEVPLAVEAQRGRTVPLTGLLLPCGVSMGREEARAAPRSGG